MDEFNKSEEKTEEEIIEELMAKLEILYPSNEGEKTKEQNKMEKYNELYDNAFDDFELEEIDNKIILNDENGDEVEFEFLDLVEYKNEEYVILLPVEDSDVAGEVVILKVEETEDDEESYVSVDDDQVLQTIFEIFKEKFKDEFNFID